VGDAHPEQPAMRKFQRREPVFFLRVQQ
jgi:hypothetical protein